MPDTPTTQHTFIHRFKSGNAASIRVTLPTPSTFALNWREPLSARDEKELRENWLPGIEAELSARMAVCIGLVFDPT
jgi:hypothetical protein